MNTISLLKKIVFALFAVFLISCEQDFNEIGADITEGDIHHNGIQKYTAHTIAFDKAMGAVQSNGLELNSLGIYNSPVFGKTTSHFVTQVELATVNPTISSNPVLDSVYLYIPYYSKAVSTTETGDTTFKLDSIYGNLETKFRLNVYESGYLLREVDPNVATSQKYFSDEKNLVENNLRGARLNDGAVAENDQFFFSNAEVVRKVEDKTVERKAPGMFLNLNKTFFENKILKGLSGKLINNNVFKEYFRGLYFQVEETNGPAALANLKFSEGTVTLKYTSDDLNTDGAVTGRSVKTLTINLKGSSVNFLENEFSGGYASAINTSDEVNGDERLYVKGGEGSVAFIDVLNDADMDFLKPANGNKTLVNEANLIFYVDNDAMGSTTQPKRIYLYDVKNKRPIIDYYSDGTTTPGNTKYNKYIHGGILEIEKATSSTRYKIRLTNHINNIINKDSTNVRLGLVVTEDIVSIGNKALKMPISSGTVEAKDVPTASVVSPLGTILYGSNANVPENKRLKLEIFYTKPN